MIYQGGKKTAKSFSRVLEDNAMQAVKPNRWAPERELHNIRKIETDCK